MKGTTGKTSRRKNALVRRKLELAKWKKMLDDTSSSDSDKKKAKIKIAIAESDIMNLQEKI